MKIEFRRGSEEIKKVQHDKQVAFENRKSKLWEFFPPKDGTVVPIWFLTEESTVFKSHQIKDGDRWTRVTCTEEFEPGSCKECAKGTGRPQDVAGWLIWDTRPFEIKVRDKNGNETGEKKKVNGSVKPLIRGLTDAALIDKKAELFGLFSRPFLVYKTGTGKQSKWTFDNGDPKALTKKQLEGYMATLPEALRGLDPYEVLEKQITPSELEEEVKAQQSDEREKVRKQIASEVVDTEDDTDDETEDEPVKKTIKLPRKLPKRK